MFDDAVLDCLDRCVLCWLATASPDGMPNVSPKELFMPLGRDTIVIANVASPQTATNIVANPRVCVAFVDVFVQKGYQMHGSARLIKKSDDEFAPLAELLVAKAGEQILFATLFKISIDRTKPILAPRYILFPDTTEQQQITDALQSYRIEELIGRKS